MTTTRDWGQSRHRERAELLGYEVELTDTAAAPAHWRPTAFMSNSHGTGARRAGRHDRRRHRGHRAAVV